MALYETILIVRQDMAAADVDNLSEKFEKTVKDGGGKVLSKEYWGLRKFAYKINKNDRGHYIMLNIDADNDAITELKRVISINEDVVRSMTLIKNADFDNNSELFVSKTAQDFKPSKAQKDEKEESSKFGSLLKTLQFDN